MNKEIREDLKEVSKHIQDVGRMVGSRNIDLGKLIAAKDCLILSIETLGAYIEIVTNDPACLNL